MDSPRFKQTGTVLIIALVMLVVLTLIGLSAMQSSTIEEIMAGNIKDCNQGFQAAESAISDAVNWIYSRNNRPKADLSASNNVYSSDAFTLGESGTPAAPDFNWSEKAIKFGALDASATTITKKINTCSPGEPAKKSNPMHDLSSLPCLVIEEHDFVPDNGDPDKRAKGIGKYYYRITTIGYGGTKKSQSRLEAILYKRYN
jgi:type IV pilus assembly protein PilX